MDTGCGWARRSGCKHNPNKSTRNIDHPHFYCMFSDKVMNKLKSSYIIFILILGILQIEGPNKYTHSPFDRLVTTCSIGTPRLNAHRNVQIQL